MNALINIEEIIQNDLDIEEQRKTLYYLHKSGMDTPLVNSLQVLLHEQLLVPVPNPGPFHKVAQLYRRIVFLPLFKTFIILFFILNLIIRATVALLSIFYPGIVKLGLLFSNPHISAIELNNLTYLQIIELAALFISACFVISGIVYIRNSRGKAYKMFEWSVLINILITQVFSFYYSQLQAIIGLIFYITILIVLRFMQKRDFQISLEQKKL